MSAKRKTALVAGVILLLFGGIQADAQPSAPLDTVAVRGYLVPASEALSTSATEPLGALVVEAELPGGAHVYSVRQPDVPGGMPTKITAAIKDGGQFTVAPFEDASNVKVVDFLGDSLVEIEGTAVWLAPIYGDNSSPLDEQRARFASLTVNGEIDALVCDESNCRPLKREIAFLYNPDYDLTAAFQTSANTLQTLRDKKILASETPAAEITKNPAAAVKSGAAGFGQNLWYDLLLAFFGGMILNVMPCVLPVIGLKIIGFFEQAGQSRSRALTLNVWYSVGILAVFAALALMSVGLSYLFTYGLFQIIMGAIVFVMALNLMGVWEIALPGFLGGKKSNDLMRREGALGAVFKGVITTLLAIPCGAPLLSPALVWTDSMIQQGRSGMALAVYLVIGLGMATPYLLLGAFPELLKFLPKPGLWMETFRNVMGFVLLLAVVWILFSMPLELVLPTVALLFALWFACWFLGQTPFDAPAAARFRRRLIALTVVLLTILLSYNVPLPRTADASGVLNPYTLENATRSKLKRWAIRADRAGALEQDEWTLFSRQKLDAALADGKTVLVDFTADWCMNCKVLESTVLKSETIEKLLGEKGIVTMTADWTSRDKTSDGREVGEMLRQYGGEQVPVVMIFSPGSEPTILRGLFTAETLAEAIQ